MEPEEVERITNEMYEKAKREGQKRYEKTLSMTREEMLIEEKRENEERVTEVEYLNRLYRDHAMLPARERMRQIMREARPMGHGSASLVRKMIGEGYPIAVLRSIPQWLAEDVYEGIIAHIGPSEGPFVYQPPWLANASPQV